jgi:hypothetical protein
VSKWKEARGASDVCLGAQNEIRYCKKIVEMEAEGISEMLPFYELLWRLVSRMPQY